MNVIAAETDAQARRLFTSLQQRFLGMVRGEMGRLPPPVDRMDGLWDARERAEVERMLRVSAVGSVESVRERLTAIQAETGADELILTAHIYDHAARLRSFELAAQAIHETGAEKRLATGR